jgi:hypothetical protein
MHRLLADSFAAVFDEVWDVAAHSVGGTATDDDIRNWLHERRLDQHNGGYEFRKKGG